MQVKGSMLMFVVKGVRAAGIEHFDHLLTDADRELLNQRILPINWYPFENYRRLFDSLVTVVARGNTRTVRQWGRDYGSTILEGVYRSVISPGNPLRSLKNYEQRFSSFYDFGALEVTETGPGSAQLEIRSFDPTWASIYEMISGWLERTIELAGGKDPRIEFLARSWAGDPSTIYSVSWKAN
jgi:uncharacterized protein (TIGR02265 family)